MSLAQICALKWQRARGRGCDGNHPQTTFIDMHSTEDEEAHSSSDVRRMVTLPERVAATRQRTGLIVGAGIGGLSAGIALRKAGWTVRVFERATSPRELGFGLAIAPNAVAALRELGVADRVLTQGVVPTRGEVRTMDGKVLKRAELPPRALGGTLVMALRPALHGALLEAVGMRTPSRWP